MLPGSSRADFPTSPRPKSKARLGIGKIGSSAMEAIARQPEASGDIRMNMIIVAALVEGVALIAIIVCLLTLFL